MLLGSWRRQSWAPDLLEGADSCLQGRNRRDLGEPIAVVSRGHGVFRVISADLELPLDAQVLACMLILCAS